MGLGSILGSIGSIVAAPFTGGTSLAFLPAAIGAGGAVADKLAGGGSDGNDEAAMKQWQAQQHQPQTPQQGHGAGGKTAEALALLGGLMAGRAMSNHAASNAVPPQVQQLMDIGTQRVAYQNPLFQAVNQGAYQMLPAFARQGTSMTGNLTNQIPAVPQQPPQQDDGMNKLLLALLAGAGGVGLGGLLTGTNPYGAVLSGLKKITGHGDHGAPFDPKAFVGPQQPTDTFEGPMVPQYQNGQWTPSGSDFQGMTDLGTGGPLSMQDLFGS